MQTTIAAMATTACHLMLSLLATGIAAIHHHKRFISIACFWGEAKARIL